MMSNLKLFGLSNAKLLVKEISKKLKIDEGSIDTFRFADGEILVKPQQTVRARDVFLFQSTSHPVNDNLMELLIAIDAMKRASAASITVVIPYFGYARQDRKSKGREPITARLVANLIENAGADKIILMDIHSEQIQGFFNSPVDTLKASGIILEKVLKDINKKDLCIISPDYGGVKRARTIATRLNVPLGIIDKRRPEPNKVEVFDILGNVQGKDCLLTDDIIDTGNTALEAVDLILKKGAKSVSIMCTHGVFSNNAIEKFINYLDSGKLKKLYITDSIEKNLSIKHNKIDVIHLCAFYADVIQAQMTGKSISWLYNKYWNKCIKNENS
ncbi:MAG: ribose-phosphate diphosphokinase [Mycoplasmoidaceae bacterium]